MAYQKFGVRVENLIFVGRAAYQLFVGRAAYLIFVGRAAYQLFVGRVVHLIFVGRAAYQLFVGRVAYLIFVGRAAYQKFAACGVLQKFVPRVAHFACYLHASSPPTLVSTAPNCPTGNLVSLGSVADGSALHHEREEKTLTLKNGFPKVDISH